MFESHVVLVQKGKTSYISRYITSNDLQKINSTSLARSLLFPFYSSLILSCSYMIAEENIFEQCDTPLGTYTGNSFAKGENMRMYEYCFKNWRLIEMFLIQSF